MKQKKFKHLKVYKQLVKNLVEQKVLERGLLLCSDKVLKQIEREVKKEIAQKIGECEQKGDYNDYIAPNLYRAHCRRAGKTKKLYDMRYVLTSENGESSLSILSDTENIPPRTMMKCFSYRKGLVTKRTKSEQLVKDILKAANRVQCIFQKAFYICGSLYFADFYLPKYKVIWEIDGGYHKTTAQKKKDEKRTAFLESVGIKVVRIQNEETEDPTIIWENLLTLVKEDKNKKRQYKN